MEKIPVGVVEEHQAIGAQRERFVEKVHVEVLEMVVSLIEIVDGDREMADAGVLVVRHGLRGPRPFARNDFENRAIWRLYEIISRIGIVDIKPEMIDVPLREFFGIGRSDRRVLQALKHKQRLYRVRAAKPSGP